MGVLGNILGGNQPQSQTQRVFPPDWIINNFGQATGASSDLFNQGPNQFFPGNTVAGFSPAQLEGMGMNLGAAQSFQPGLNFGGLGVQPALQQMLNVNENIAQDPTVAPLLENIEQRGTQNLLENILPQARSLATQSGQTFGSTKGDQLQADAIQRTQDSILGAQAGVLGQARGQELDAQARAIAGLPGAQAGFLQGQQSLFTPGNIFGQVGLQQQQQAQNQINADRERFDFGQNAPGQSLDDFIRRTLGLSAGGGGAQSTFNDSAGSNALSNALGFGLLGAGAGSLIPGLGAGPGSAFGPAGIGLGLGSALLGALL